MDLVFGLSAEYIPDISDAAGLTLKFAKGEGIETIQFAFYSDYTV